MVAVEAERTRLEELGAQENVTVWANSELTLLGGYGRRDEYSINELDEHPLDMSPSGGGIDCRPFRPAVTRGLIRELLTVASVWREGFRGQNIVVGIIDEGVNGQVYPVINRLSHPDVPRLPGGAPIDSHGSMCAADVLIAAPAAKLYDYPFLGVPRSGGALAMFQAVLDQRRQDGTPHLTNNSYGFTGRPTQAQAPNHEIWDINHPLHRKVREVIASGAPAFLRRATAEPSARAAIATQAGSDRGSQSMHLTASPR